MSGRDRRDRTHGKGGKGRSRQEDRQEDRGTTSTNEDHSTEWSDWIRHPETGRLFLWKLDKAGKTLIHWGEETPDPTEPRYDGTEALCSVEALSNDLAGTSITSSSSSTLARAPSYDPTDATSPNYNLSRSPPSSGYNAPSGSLNASGTKDWEVDPPNPPEAGDGKQVVAGSSGYHTGAYNTSAYNTTGSSTGIYRVGGHVSAGKSTSYSTNTKSISPYQNPTGIGPLPGSTNDVPPATFEDSRRRHVDGDVTPRNIGENEANYSSGLDSNFKVHRSKNFKAGYIFKILWSEPQSATSGSRGGTIITENEQLQDGNMVFTKPRRFIITGVGRGFNRCVPILTYGHRGLHKPGLDPNEHAVIYTGDSPPENDENLARLPIQMSTKTARDRLDPKSRIHYAKTYTVEHNVRVHIIGKIAEGSVRAFVTDLEDVQGTIEGFNLD